MKIEYRQTTRGACCSSCNKYIIKNKDYANTFRGFRSKQGQIFICNDCVKEMYNNIE